MSQNVEREGGGGWFVLRVEERVSLICSSLSRNKLPLMDGLEGRTFMCVCVGGCQLPRHHTAVPHINNHPTNVFTSLKPTADVCVDSDSAENVQLRHICSSLKVTTWSFSDQLLQVTKDPVLDVDRDVSRDACIHTEMCKELIFSFHRKQRQHRESFV